MDEDVRKAIEAQQKSDEAARNAQTFQTKINAANQAGANALDRQHNAVQAAKDRLHQLQLLGHQFDASTLQQFYTAFLGQEMTRQQQYWQSRETNAGRENEAWQGERNAMQQLAGSGYLPYYDGPEGEVFKQRDQERMQAIQEGRLPGWMAEDLAQKQGSQAQEFNTSVGGQRGMMPGTLANAMVQNTVARQNSADAVRLAEQYRDEVSKTLEERFRQRDLGRAGNYGQVAYDPNAVPGAQDRRPPRVDPNALRDGRPTSGDLGMTHSPETASGGFTIPGAPFGTPRTPGTPDTWVPPTTTTGQPEPVFANQPGASPPPESVNPLGDSPTVANGGIGSVTANSQAAAGNTAADDARRTRDEAARNPMHSDAVYELKYGEDPYGPKPAPGAPPESVNPLAPTSPEQLDELRGGRRVNRTLEKQAENNTWNRQRTPGKQPGRSSVRRRGY